MTLQKNDPKKHQKNDRFLDPFFGHLGSILETKLGPCWHPNRSHIKVIYDKQIFYKKSLFFSRKYYYVQGSGGPSWEQKSNKNRSKKEFNMGRHLGIDFWMILVDFGRQVGVENRAKSIQKGIEKVMKTRRSPRWQKNRFKSEWSKSPAGFQSPGESPPLRRDTGNPPLASPGL